MRAETGAPVPDRPAWRPLARLRAWFLDRVADPAFQRRAARLPLARAVLRRDAERLHDVVSGFVYSQVLLAAVETGLLETLRRGPQRAEALALALGADRARVETLCQSAAALGLLVRRRGGVYGLGRLGAAVLGAPGLVEMIRHHRVFYRDLADPVALIRGEAETELSRFWPYVRGEGAGIPPETAAAYSRLMEVSQRMVAEETLAVAPMRGIRHLVDVGGGTGAFLAAVAARHPDLALTLFDLPPVAEVARARLRDAGLAGRIGVVPGSFREDVLPPGDAISLVRVLYDHDDSTAALILARAFEALPPGGRIIVSEPMSRGARPERAGDAYFGFYTMAMGTGRARSPECHGELMHAAGFESVRTDRKSVV